MIFQGENEPVLFLKRMTKFLIFMAFILVPFNYFFAHFSFNRVLNDFVQTRLIEGQTLTFKSSFHFYPSPSIQIDGIDYKDKSGLILTIKQLKTLVNLTSVIKTKSFLIDEFTLNSLTFRLPKKAFDELLKAIMFPLIREGLGVPKDPSKHLPSRFSMTNVILERTEGGDNSDAFEIASLTYDTHEKVYMKVCFSSHDKTVAFYQKFIAQYLLIAKVEGDCLTFTKSLNPIALPSNLSTDPALKNSEPQKEAK